MTENLQKQNEELISGLAPIQKQNSQLHSQIESTHAKFESLQKQNLQLSSQIENINAKHNSLKNENANINADINFKLKMIGDLQKEKDKLHSQIETTKQQQFKQVGEIQNRINNYEITLNNLNSSLATKEMELTQRAKEIYNLKTIITSKDEEILNLRMRGGVRNPVINEITTKFDNISNEILLNFFSECEEYIPKQEHQVFFVKLNDACFRENFFIDCDKSLSDDVIISTFKKMVMEELSTFRIPWDNSTILEKFNLLAVSVVDLLKSIENCNPRLNFIKPKKGEFFNPEKHESANIVPAQILTTKTPGLLCAFGGEVFVKAVVSLKEK